MDIIEKEIKKFLDRWSVKENRQNMDIDLHFFMRAVMKTHSEMLEPESYTPARKNI